MGLFGKISNNLHHGGVKVRLEAPASVPSNEVIPVTVNITADSTQTINAVKVEIKAQEREQGMGMGGVGVGIGNNNMNNGYNNQQSTEQTVAVVESRETFTINAGETKTVQLQLALNGTAAMGNGLSQLQGAAGNFGNALAAIASVASNFENISYTYSVHAYVDVADIAMDPSDKQPIQILPPVQQAPAPQPVQPQTVAAPAPLPPTSNPSGLPLQQ
jgi:hypothetical protein